MKRMTLLFVLIASSTLAQAYAGEGSYISSVFPAHEPYGKGKGTMPGRVVWAYDRDCVDWEDGYWWEESNFNYNSIQTMTDHSIAALAGRDNPRDGWEALFRAHNLHRGKNDSGYLAGEKIAIKANMNGSGLSGSNESRETNIYINPVAMKALLVSLVRDAGVAPADITVFDASRVVPQHMQKLCGTGLLQGVKFRYQDIGSPNDCIADTNHPVTWSRTFSGETSFFPTCVTEAEYLIDFANLKGHSMNGVTLSAKNHFGTIMNSNRAGPPYAAGIHRFVNADAMGQYTVLVDLLANHQIGEKEVLYILDGIIVSPSEGATTTISSGNAKWQSPPFNDDYTSSLFFSQDPVALDSVGTDFLASEPIINQYNRVLRNNPNVENYLHEAGSVSNAPSGIVYKNGNGKVVENLGVHEHWNNPVDKQYSRNLGKAEGIELIHITN